MSAEGLSKVVLAEKLALVDRPWDPKIVAELNGQQVRIAKLAGPFVWHRHEAEDELFLLLAGKLRIELRDGAVELEPGELVVVPRGIEHRPVADGEAHVLLFEPASTLNTGNMRDERTVESPERI